MQYPIFMTETIPFTTTEGNHLKMTLYGRDLPASSPCVVYVHGFKGFKDWGFAPPTGEEFALKGIRFLAMNFSHNGIGENPMEFTEADKFRDNNFSLELSEAMQVIQAYAQGELFDAEPGVKMGLLGHSRGGGIALLAGARSPELAAVTTWAAVSTFKRYSKEMIDHWRETGLLEIRNARTGQILHLGWQIHDDLMDNIHDKFNIEATTAEMGKPLCVIHGGADPVVLPGDAENIRSWAGSWCNDFHLVPEGDHTFGAKQPWQGSTPQLDAVWEHTLSFFTKHLLP